MVGLIRWPHNNNNKTRCGRPYVYSPTTVILRCFIVRVWFRLDSNRALREYLAMEMPYNRKVMRGGCGLSRVPSSRRTFDRRLVTISAGDIKNRIIAMSELFVREKIVDPSIILSTDSILVKAKGHVWYKSSMKKKVVPCSGIDTEMQDGEGFSHTKGWLGIWIQTTFDIKYRFNHSTIGSRFYNCQHT